MEAPDTALSEAPLERSEMRDARRRAAPRAVVVYEAIRGEGEWELGRTNKELGWSAFAAGMSMGFSFVAEALLMARLPDEEWVPLVGKFGYSFGFLIVILGRQQLFTENTLTPVLPFLGDKSSAMLKQLLRLWCIVLGFNVVGALVMASLLAHLNLFDGPVADELSRIAHETVESSFIVTIGKALLAGWLVALLVWLLPFAETGRVLVIILITYLIGIGGFFHIIAGTIEAAYGVFEGEIHVMQALSGFFVPTLLGNVVGGVSFVALINHAQVSKVFSREES